MAVKTTKMFLKGLARGLTHTGHTITGIINTVLLLIIYFIGVGTAAIITKLAKQELIALEKKNTATYYNDKKIETENIQEYYKQY